MKLSRGGRPVPVSVRVESLSAPLGPSGLPVLGAGSQAKEEAEGTPADSSRHGGGQAE